MAAFLMGIVAAVAIALIGGLTLNAFDQSTPGAFYTSYTVPLGQTPPTDGTLDHHAKQQQQQK